MYNSYYIFFYFSCLLYFACRNVDKTEGKMVQTTGSCSREGGPGPVLCCVCFWNSRWYHYLSTVQINLSHQAQVTLQLRVNYFRFSAKIFSLSALAGAPQSLPHRCSNLLSAALVSRPLHVFFLRDSCCFPVLRTFLAWKSRGNAQKHHVSILQKTFTQTDFIRYCYFLTNTTNIFRTRDLPPPTT